MTLATLLILAGPAKADLHKQNPVPAIARQLLVEPKPAFALAEERIVEAPPAPPTTLPEVGVPLPTPSRGLPSKERLALVDSARKELGVPYVWGGTSSAGYDCSGYIYTMYAQRGIELPRMADEQFYAGVPVAKDDLQPGDLVFFETYMPGPSHAGIYVGNGRFVHASSGAGEVTETPLDKEYYVERFLGARRPVAWAG